MGPLENLLFLCQHDTSLFPRGRGNYYGKFIVIRDAFKNDGRFINARLALNDDFLPTDHGPDHVDAVINSAELLLEGCFEQAKSNAISPYEAFMLLIAIYTHDAGNIFERDGHEQYCLKTLRHASSDSLTDVELTNISRIASAHGGHVLIDGKKERDTIGILINKSDNSYLGSKFRPQLLAAITRFADEICEDQSRVSRYLLDNGQINPDSVIFHRYAYCITNVTFDGPDKSVRVSFTVPVEWLFEKLAKPTRDGLVDTYLIDEIFFRLNKMNCERHYCSRFIGDILAVRNIKADITIEHHDHANSRCVTLQNGVHQFTDSGYPSLPQALQDAEWQGDAIAQKFREVLA
jgi:hypothetical protein